MQCWLFKDNVLKKSVAMNRDELTELISVQKDTEKQICLMLQNRTNTSIVKMKELCGNGNLIKMTGIFGSLTWNRHAQYYQISSWRGRLTPKVAVCLSIRLFTF